YYIGYITTIFLALLTIFFAISSLIFKDRKPKKLISSLLKILTYTILSLLSSLVVFFPSWLAQKSVFQEKMKYQYLPLFKSFDGLANFFPKISVNNVPFLYTSLLVLLLATAFFFNRNIKGTERHLTGIFALLLFISVWLSTFYQVWHAFTMPNGYPSRESFILIFGIVCLAYRTLKVQFDNPKVQLAKPFWLLIILLGFYSYFTQYFSGLLILEIIVALIVYLMLLFLCFQRNIKLTRFISLMVLSLTLFELNFVYKSDIAQKVKDSYRIDSFSYVYQGTKKILNRVAKKDPNFYRIASTYQINPNDPLLFNYNGIQNYLSQQPTKETNFLSAAGYFQKHSWIRWSTYNNGSTLAMDSLLGVKYLLLNNNQQLNMALKRTSSLAAFNSTTPQYFSHTIVKQHSFKIAKNNMAFPLIFRGIKSANQVNVNYSTNGDPFKIQNLIFSVLTNQQEIFKNQVTSFKNTPNYYYSAFKLDHSGYTYLYLPTNFNVNPPNTIKVYVNGKFITQAYGKSLFAENGIICLGKYKKDMSISVLIKGRNITDQITGTPIIAVESQKKFTHVYQEAVKNSQIKIKEVQGTFIKFKTTKFFKNGFAVLSIPYDQGWQVQVDGKPAKLKRTLGELSGIQLTSGTHSVNLYYHVPGLKISSIVSLLSLISLICISFWKKKRA
ncbi:MAG: YfhO family protein, partial [Liquorilactobacillus ghanensis]